MFGSLGTGEILIIAVVVLTLFGTKKLNDLAHGLGKSTREYKKLKNELDDAVDTYERDIDVPTKKKEVNKKTKTDDKGGD